jgi:hypothetical protein
VMQLESRSGSDVGAAVVGRPPLPRVEIPGKKNRDSNCTTT